MKKILATALALVFLFLIFPGAFALPLPPAAENGAAEGYWDYSVDPDDGTAAVTKYRGPGGAVTVPAVLGGHTVTAVECVFRDRGDLTRVTVGDGVKEIGLAAFLRCTGLTEIILPESVVSVGDLAFSGCTGLTGIALPDGVAFIGEGAFSGCAGLTEIAIPDGVASIGSDAFHECAGLTRVTLGKGVKTVGDGAFSGCASLTEIALPENLERIGEGAFEGCADLAKITLPAKLAFIGRYAFYGCEGLRDVYYRGTREQWNSVLVMAENLPLIDATRHFGPTDDVLWGDANEDGRISTADIVRLKNYLANYDYETKTSTYTTGPGADANGDEKITTADIVRLKNYLANYDYETGTSAYTLGSGDQQTEE